MAEPANAGRLIDRAGAGALMTPVEMRALISRYIDAYNQFDVDGMLGTLHPEIEFKNMVSGEITASTIGIQAFRSLAEQSVTLFSRREQRITALDVREDGATVSLDFRAVLAVDLPHDLKQGQELRLTGSSEFHFRDGLVDRLSDVS
jgi:hypothetical protein